MSGYKAVGATVLMGLDSSLSGLRAMSGPFGGFFHWLLALKHQFPLNTVFFGCLNAVVMTCEDRAPLRIDYPKGFHAA